MAGGRGVEHHTPEVLVLGRLQELHHLCDGDGLVHAGRRRVQQLAQLQLLELIRHSAQAQPVQRLVQLAPAVVRQHLAQLRLGLAGRGVAGRAGVGWGQALLATHGRARGGTRGRGLGLSRVRHCLLPPLLPHLLGVQLQPPQRQLSAQW